MAKILFFGPLKDVSGEAARDMALPSSVNSPAGLIDYIRVSDEALGLALRAPSVRVIVNNVIVERSAAISDGDEIAFLPPFSGG